MKNRRTVRPVLLQNSTDNCYLELHSVVGVPLKIFQQLPLLMMIPWRIFCWKFLRKIHCTVRYLPNGDIDLKCQPNSENTNTVSIVLKSPETLKILVQWPVKQMNPRKIHIFFLRIAKVTKNCESTKRIRKGRVGCSLPNRKNRMIFWISFFINKTKSINAFFLSLVSWHL